MDLTKDIEVELYANQSFFKVQQQLCASSLGLVVCKLALVGLIIKPNTQAQLANSTHPLQRSNNDFDGVQHDSSFTRS